MRSFRARIRATERSRRASLTRPERTAATRLSLAWRGFSGMRRMSAPASSARTMASRAPKRRVIAAMFMASVTMRPSNPISPRSRSERTAGDRVLGIEAEPVTEGMDTCALMTAPMPAATASRKGRSSIRSRRSRSTRMTGRATWESTPVSPWPGKCLPVATAPCSWSPRTNAAPSRATSAGSSPKERVAMTGLSGLLLTSSTGAKGRWTPTARASTAVMRPISRARLSSPVAPTAISDGNRVAPPSSMSLGR